MRRIVLPCLLALNLSVYCAQTAERDAETDYAEKFLQEEHIPTDGASLVQFFKERALAKPPDPELIKELVIGLGDDDFAARESAEEKLTGMGRAAKEALLEARKSRDAEVRFRADRCLEKLEENREMLRVVYAARVLADRKPAGATEALLNYLPWAKDEMAEEAIFAAIAKVGVSDTTPNATLVDALNDTEPLRRAAAGRVLATLKDQRTNVLKLLDDADPRVRYYTASVLMPLGEKRAVDTLIVLLADTNLITAHLAEDMLFRLADSQKAPEVTVNNDESSRNRARSAWEAWWKEHRDKIDLAKLNLDQAVMGYTVIAEYSDSGHGMGRVWECGPDGKQRWEITDVSSPMDVQVLRNGHVLIAERGRITERNSTGKVLWEVKVQADATACQRLANGNTVAFTYNGIFEYERDGKEIFRYQHNGQCYGGQKLRNGNYVFMVGGSGQITEVNPEGKEVRSFRPDTPDVSGCGYWVSIEGMPNGNYFVSLGSSGRVAEIDVTGKVLWSCKTEQTTGATRLRNGNALCVNTESRAVVEYDRDGKEVWRAKTIGRPFRVRRY